MKDYEFWHYLLDKKLHHFVKIIENGVVRYYVDGGLVHQTSDTNISYNKKS
jgi:hypothetical protein